MDVIVPKLLGRNTGGVLKKWFASEGDTVQEGTQLYEVQLDKSNTTKTAPATGVFHPLVKEGAFIKTGMKIAQIEEA